MTKEQYRFLQNQKRTNKNEANYKLLLAKVLSKGTKSNDRTGVGTLVLTNQVLDIDMQQVPIVTAKKMFWKTAIKELELFIQGKTHINDFKAKGINYWDKFANEFGELGPIYGAQWINFGGVNQLEAVIKSIREKPYSRRHIISAWNPVDMPKMSLPPCPVLVQLHVVDNKLDALVYQRSADSFLGVPFDIFQYYLLVRYINTKSGMNYALGKLSFVYGNFHIYSNHLEQVKTYLNTKVHKAPTIKDDLDDDKINWELENYKHEKYIKGEINN